MILILDNRDSFTFNLAQTLEALGAPVRVEKSSTMTTKDLLRMRPRGILLGPGPGTPSRAGCCENLLREVDEIPILGICLGHQAIATALGGRLVQAKELCHGQTRPVTHDGKGVFEGLQNPLDLTLYNSLVVDEPSLPEELIVSARGPLGEVAGLRHRDRPQEGVQGHPESMLCVESGGRDLLENFTLSCGLASVRT